MRVMTIKISDGELDNVSDEIIMDTLLGAMESASYNAMDDEEAELHNSVQNGLELFGGNQANCITIINEWNDADPAIVTLADCTREALIDALQAIITTSDTFGCLDQVFVRITHSTPQLNMSKTCAELALERIKNGM